MLDRYKAVDSLLGDFTFMKTYRILGILWLALCAYYGITLLWQLGDFFLTPKHRATLDLYFEVLTCLLLLAGAVASFFLFRGARWARRFVGMIAVLGVIACIGQVITFRSFPIFVGIFGAFVLASAVLLFWPRHEPVA